MIFTISWLFCDYIVIQVSEQVKITLQYTCKKLNYVFCMFNPKIMCQLPFSSQVFERREKLIIVGWPVIAWLEYTRNIKETTNKLNQSIIWSIG